MITPKVYDWKKQSLVSEHAFRIHVELYERYCNATNMDSSDTYSSNGVTLHEHFFDIIIGEVNTKNMVKIDGFKKQFKKVALESRGWTIYGINKLTNEYTFISLESHDNGMMIDFEPLIVCDGYEHSYILTYGNDKERYIDAFLINM